MPDPEFYHYPLFENKNGTDSPHTSATLDLGAYTSISIQVVDDGGDIGGADSLAIQQSNDGETWVALGSAITAAGVTEDAIYTRYLRGVLTMDTGSDLSVFIVAKP